MTLIASCGHDISNSKYVSLNTMDFTTDWDEQKMSRCVIFGCYCAECATAYESYGIVLHTLGEQNDWLSGKTNYPTIDIDA